tara:strand:- start:11201 stop:11866 length:666 start_codon:yes stop_codon:yes gene_type:complete
MDLLPKVQVDLIEEEPEMLIEEMESDGEDTESALPEVKHRPVIPEEAIFQEKILKVKAVPKEKKKRVMSEEQLERLRLGREKGLAKRRAAAAEKQEIKDLHKKKKQNEIAALRREAGVEEAPAPQPLPKPTKHEPEPQPEPRKSYNSLEDLPADLLVQLQQAAIEGYDTKRKARKAQKIKDKQSNYVKDAKMNMISDAIKPRQPPKYGEAGYFSSMWSLDR